MKRMAVITWIHKQLLALYPASYRSLFADEMEEVFRRALQERAGHDPLKLALLLLREVRDLPLSLLHAHNRQRKLALATQESGAGMAQHAHFENVALRLRPWVFVMLITLIVAVALHTTWLVTRTSYSGNREVPRLSGSSAIILEDEGSFVRLPQTALRCTATGGENNVLCTADVGKETLQFSITIVGHGSGSYSGTCSGSYATHPIDCVQLFTRAKDRSMPPVLVQRPRALADAQWQELARRYAFIYPTNEGLVQWGLAFSSLLSLAVVVVMWSASRADPGRIEGRIRSFGWLVGSMVAGIGFFIPLAWLLLMLSFQLEKWIERF